MGGLGRVVGGGGRVSCLVAHVIACKYGSYRDTDQYLFLGSANSIGSGGVIVTWLVPGGPSGAVRGLL